MGARVFQLGKVPKGGTIKNYLGYGPHLETAVRINMGNGFGAFELGGFYGVHWTEQSSGPRTNTGFFFTLDVFDLVTLFDLIVGE